MLHTSGCLPKESVVSAIAEILGSKGVIVGDGGMGTQLFDRGLTAGDPPERWNVENADLIEGVRRSGIVVHGEQWGPEGLLVTQIRR